MAEMAGNKDGNQIDPRVQRKQSGESGAVSKRVDLLPVGSKQSGNYRACETPGGVLTAAKQVLVRRPFLSSLLDASFLRSKILRERDLSPRVFSLSRNDTHHSGLERTLSISQRGF
jgi:hypothetical protein